MMHVQAFAWLLVAAAHAADQPGELSTVTGRVLNGVTGEPVKKAELALRNQTNPSAPADSATTGETGAFSFRVTEGGRYQLVVQRNGFVQASKVLAITSGQNEAGLTIRLTPEGIVAGKVIDAEGDPVPGAMVHAIRFPSTRTANRYSIVATTSTNDLGEYRIFDLPPGSYYLGAVRRTQTDVVAVYYPGTQQVGQAVSVDVPAGGELRGMNLKLSSAHSVKVRGTLHGPPGLPVAGIRVVAAPCDSGPLQRVSTQVRTADGFFELRDVAPGCYILAADSFTSGRRFSARLPVDAGRSDIQDLRLNLLPPVQLAAQVHCDDAANPKPVRVVVNLDSRLSMVTASGASTEDGSLLLNNIVPETYQLSAVLPDGYYLKSARFDGVDVLESGLDLSRGAAGRLEMEISTAGGRVDGSVSDPREQPVAGARVVLIPDNPRAATSRLKTAVTDYNGAFLIRDIAPGDYAIYAFQDLDPGPHQTKRLSIRDHAHEITQLKISGVPE